MVFEVRLSLLAETDLEKAILYYQQINDNLSTRFHVEFDGLITLLEPKPYFEKKITKCELAI